MTTTPSLPTRSQAATILLLVVLGVLVVSALSLFVTEILSFVDALIQLFNGP